MTGFAWRRKQTYRKKTHHSTCNLLYFQLGGPSQSFSDGSNWTCDTASRTAQFFQNINYYGRFFSFFSFSMWDTCISTSWLTYCLCALSSGQHHHCFSPVVDLLFSAIFTNLNSIADNLCCISDRTVFSLMLFRGSPHQAALLTLKTILQCKNRFLWCNLRNMETIAHIKKQSKPRANSACMPDGRPSLDQS